MSLRSLLVVVGAFLLGVGVQTVAPVSLSVMGLLMVVGFAVAVVGRRNPAGISPPHLTLLTLALVCFTFGLLRTEVHSWQFGVSPLERQLGQEVELTGIVVREPDVRERTTHLYTRVGDDLVLVFASRFTDLAYGDRIVVVGEVARPEVFTTELGREFNYPGYLQARDVEYTMSFADVEVRESGQGNPLFAPLLSFKQVLLASIESYIPQPQAAVGQGILLGVKQALGKELERDFRRSGIIHIVVLSGYNVMLVVAFALFIFSFFFRPRGRMIAGVIAIILFALLVGLSATVVRASIMAALVLIAQGFGREYSVVRALLLAGGIMVAINPLILVYDIGFQLSFMATLGLILTVPYFESSVTTHGRVFRWQDYVYATVATQIAVLPLLLYHIGEVSLVAVLINVLVLPMVPVAMLLTFLTALVGMMSGAAVFVGAIAYYSLAYITSVASWGASVPFATLTVSAFHPIFIALAYGALAFIWWLYSQRQRQESVVAGWTIEEVDDEKGAPALAGAPIQTEDKLPIIFAKRDVRLLLPS